MSPHRWFLPDEPDVLGLLDAQSAVTVEAIDALVRWAQGDAAAGDAVRRLEHDADRRKLALREALTKAFTTPLEPEELFELSVDIDTIVNTAKDTVREAELMGMAPDEAMALMADQLAEGTHHLADAVAALGRRGSVEGATAAADRAIKAQRRMEHSYRAAMPPLLEIDDVREVTGRRELYRRLARTGDALAAAGERVWYAVLKEG